MEGATPLLANLGLRRLGVGVGRQGGMGEAIGDADLVRAAKAGDVGAFGELYRRHVSGVAALARTRLRDRSAAHDVAHEAFAAALPRLSQLRDDERFGSWVRTIAANLCVKMNRGPAADAPLMVDLRDEISDSPERVVERRETVAAVQAALGELSAADRELIVLRDLEEWRLGDVAEARGLTYGSTEVAMARARGRLRTVCERLQLIVVALVAAVWRRLTPRSPVGADASMRLAAAALPTLVVAAALLLEPGEAGGAREASVPPAAASTGTATVTVPGPFRGTPASAAGGQIDDGRRGDAGGGPPPVGDAGPSIELFQAVKVSRSRPDRPESFAARATVTVGDDRYATGVSGGHDDIRPPSSDCGTAPIEASPDADAGPVSVQTELRHSDC